MKEEELINEVKDTLKQKRYLLVLDDIWSDESWDTLKRAFPKGKKGSKVLLTTRIKEVALHADPWSSIVEPPFLTIEEGWELLSKKAFPCDIIADQQGYVDEFEMIGKEIVRKCDGLPLAIVVIGCLLANKSLREWMKVKEDINARLKKLGEKNPYAGVEWILALSYHDLPFKLKPCFLYLSQFPEDHEFHKKKLVRMWIAEGFVPEPSNGDGEETMEDVGEQYLEELVNRCMVQVSKRDYTGIGIKACRMHDLMRHMCVSKARDENFLRAITKHGEIEATNSGPLHSSLLKARRIGFHSEIFLRASLKEFGPDLRSFLSHVKLWVEVGFTFKKFKLLRVLDVHKSSPFFPRQVDNLIHLRYLSIKIEKSLTFIGKFRSLYTLDLRKPSQRIQIPNVLWKLPSLRHLLVDEDTRGKFQLDTLKHLETVKWVNAENFIRKDAMSKLTNVRNLKIRFDTREVEVVIRSPIVQLGHLRSLGMMLKSKNASFQSLEPLFACQHLTKLSLVGVIEEEKGKNQKFLPESMSKLILRYSKLKQDPMGVLEKLPNLRTLFLEAASYEGVQMVCSSHGFSKLEILQLRSLDNLVEWRIEEDAMPCLKSLLLENLEKLKMLPDGLRFVTTLRELTLLGVEQIRSRVEVIVGVKGEDFDKIRHVPFIKVR